LYYPSAESKVDEQPGVSTEDGSSNDFSYDGPVE
jgi:hypothetical protein